MTQFKRGDRVKVIGEGRHVGKTGVIQNSDEGFSGNHREVLDVRFDGNGGAGLFNYKLELIKENTMDNLQPGDIIIDKVGNELEVKLANSEYVLTIDIYDKSNDVSAHTVNHLKILGYTIKSDETELTLKQIADKFNIDVSKLRIKEEK